jgi:hypothetical protein
MGENSNIVADGYSRLYSAIHDQVWKEYRAQLEGTEGYWWNKCEVKRNIEREIRKRMKGNGASGYSCWISK